MSFVGGGSECSVNGNAVAQFNKHTQQDHSLQRQVAQPGMLQQSNGFKQDNMMNSRERSNMDQFMNNSGPQHSSFNFQPMRHELNMMQKNSPQSNWSQEFSSPPPMLQTAKPVHNQPVMQSSSPVNWSQDFQKEVTMQHQHQPQHQMQPGFQSTSMMGGYRSMMPMMSMQSNMSQMQQPQPVQDQNQQVDWDNQFKEIENLESQAKEISEEKVESKEEDEIVIDDKYQATFQEVWDGLNSEALENDFISQQYEDFKSTKLDTLPADMNQWERDFARYASTRANFGEYQFEDKSSNQFLDLPADQDPYEIGVQLMENGAKLSEAALAFEAAIQRDQGHINAWLKLGEVQTQNEKEIAGISALEKCLELHPENSEALMTLAISYINEGYDNAAFATLERWISTKYPQIADKARQENPSISDEDRFSLNKRVSELFIKAAQLSPNQANMDADVQMGLGVLFYANEDFDKTIDCFRAALTIKPDDAVLWNRLGASLANSNRSEEAVEAYFKALELKPTFVRARYNLGVSCINIGCYKEAAEHLLSGLSMHQVEGVTNDGNGGSGLNHNQSTALTETLKRAFIAMERRDLLEKVKPGMDLTQFRGEFNF
jgi:peroxin-5